MHYSRVRRYGDLNANHRTKSAEELRGRYRYLRLKADHALGKAGQSVPEHRMILWEKIGPGEHPCHHCGAPVRWEDGTLHSDHLNRDPKDNRRENLVPSCQTCNIRNRDYTIRPDEAAYITKGRKVRGVVRNCATCNSEFITSALDKRPNHGRFCSRSCARRHPHRTPTSPTAAPHPHA